MLKQLSVWLLGVHVGTLTQERGRMAFGYAASYPLSAPPLSQALPVRAEPFNDASSRAFFAGLLPEGDKRRLNAQALWCCWSLVKCQLLLMLLRKCVGWTMRN